MESIPGLHKRLKIRAPFSADRPPFKGRTLRDVTQIKKENKICLIYKEIQNEAVAMSYIYEEGLPILIYEKTRKYFALFEEAVSHIRLATALF